MHTTLYCPLSLSGAPYLSLYRSLLPTAHDTRRHDTLEEVHEARGAEYIEQPLYGAAGTCCLYHLHFPTMRAELIGHFQACITEIHLHIDARMADYMATHP